MQHSHLNRWFNRIFSMLIICAVLFPSPFVFPKRNAYAFSIGEEKKIGDELLSVVRKNFDLIDAPDVKQYINQLGHEVLSVTGIQFFNYHFFVIKDSEFNAFAAPSGLIFIHSGLIEAMESEEELISVLAHECGHVKSRHIANRMKKMSKTSIATAALLIAGIAMGGGALSEALITGSMAAGSSLNLKFSRQDEEEADRLAYSWMKRIGAEPKAMASMLNKMHKISVYRMANIPPYLLTHPEPKTRLGYVQDLLLNDTEIKPKQKQRDNVLFLRIKQRILILSKRPEYLAKHTARTLSNPDESNIAKLMAHYGLHLVALENRDFLTAENELRKVIQSYPNHMIFQTDQAMILYKKGEYDSARDLLLQVLKQSPLDTYTRFLLGQTYMETEEHDKALPLFTALLADWPDDATLHYQIGQIKSILGEKGEGHFHLGLYYWFEGDAKAATFHLNLAITDEHTPKKIRQQAEDFKQKIKEIQKG